MRKPVGRGNGNAAPAPTGFGALGIGNAGNGTRRIFGLGRPFRQSIGVGFLFVATLQIWKISRLLVRIGEPAKGVFRDRTGHGNGAFDQFIQRWRRGIRRGNDGLTRP